MENIWDFAVSEGCWLSLPTASISTSDIAKFEIMFTILWHHQFHYHSRWFAEDKEETDKPFSFFIM
jgi:hypothetical protein